MADILTHEEKYRGQQIMKKRSAAKIVIMGAGALGSRLLDALVCQGYIPAIVDFDKVERHNLGNQLYGPPDVGKLKATQSANNTYRRLGVKCDSVAKKVTKENVSNIIKGYDLVIDAFDNLESRILLKTTCWKASIPCLHCAMSHDGFGEASWSESYPVEKFTDQRRENDPCEYPLAVNLVLFTVAFAAETINNFVDEGKKESIQFTLKDMRSHKGD